MPIYHDCKNTGYWWWYSGKVVCVVRIASGDALDPAERLFDHMTQPWAIAAQLNHDSLTCSFYKRG